jgi:hypothetical protein
MAPIFEDMWTLRLEQRGTAKTAFDAVNGMINSMTKTTVFSRCRMVSWEEWLKSSGAWT